MAIINPKLATAKIFGTGPSRVFPPQIRKFFNHPQLSGNHQPVYMFTTKIRLISSQYLNSFGIPHRQY